MNTSLRLQSIGTLPKFASSTAIKTVQMYDANSEQTLASIVKKWLPKAANLAVAITGEGPTRKAHVFLNMEDARDKVNGKYGGTLIIYKTNGRLENDGLGSVHIFNPQHSRAKKNPFYKK